MTHTALDQLYDTLGSDNALETLYEQFVQPDWFTSDAQSQILRTRVAFLETVRFGDLGVEDEEKAAFIRTELLLIQDLLHPIALLKYPDDLNGLEKGSVVKAFEDAAHRLGYTLEHYTGRLKKNYNTKLPITIENLKAHVSDLFDYLKQECFIKAFCFGDCPYWWVFSEWQEEMNNLYTQAVLATRLELLKQGPHPLQQKALESITFPELFKNRALAEGILGVLAEQQLIDAGSGRWIDERGGKKKELIQIMRTLKAKGYFREDIALSDVIFHQAVLNSFKLKVSISFFQKNKKDRSGIDYIPSPDPKLVGPKVPQVQ